MAGLKKKYTVLVYILLLSVLLFGGCGKSVDKNQKTQITDWPEEVSYCYAISDIAFSGNKELYVEEGVMHIRDMESDRSTVLCTYPNCTHSSHSATGGGSHCEATSPPNAFEDFEAVALHGDTVFQFILTEDNIYDTQLYVSHVGQSGRKKVATLPYEVSRSTWYFYFEKNNAYFMAEQKTLNEDGTQITKTRCVLLQMNLDTYEITELDECSSGGSIQAGLIDYSNGVLAYEIIETEKGKGDYSKVHLYNVQTKEKKVLESFKFYRKNGYSEYLGYREGCIYYVSEIGDKIVKREVDSGEETSIVTLEGEKVFYNCNMRYNMGVEYETSNLDTTDADNWDSEDKRMYYYSFEDGKTYPVKQEYTKVSSMEGMLSKDTAYYWELKNDKFELKRIPSEEYLDKKED